MWIKKMEQAIRDYYSFYDRTGVFDTNILKRVRDEIVADSDRRLSDLASGAGDGPDREC